jgi:CubicO group peptidase (beta-lactamase class C family)
MRAAALFALAAAAAAQAAATPPVIAADPALATKLRVAENWVRTQMARENVPGASMAIVHDQQVVWAKGFGVADVKSKAPATPQTRYSICSVSKLFTSMAAMRERDAGRLDLDRPLASYLEGYSLPGNDDGEGEITPRSIMTHSSGLPREADFRYWSDQKFPTLQDLKSRLGQQRRLFQPFDRHQYSNLGMSLLGEVVASVSGQTYHDYVRANFLQPLGMARTTSDIPLELRGRELAVPYGHRKFGWERRPHEPYRINALAPAAGFVSTVEDLAKFASWQFRLLGRGGTEILKATTLREMQRLHYLPPDASLNMSKQSFGLGFQNYQKNGKSFIGHGGGCPGYKSYFLMRPQEKLAYIVMFNVGDIDSRHFAHELYDLTASDVAASTRAGPAGAPQDELSEYEGLYATDGYAWDIYVGSYKGELIIADMFSSSPSQADRYRKVGKDAFRQVREDGSLADEARFERNAKGQVWRIWQDSDYLERVPQRGR